VRRLASYAVGLATVLTLGLHGPAGPAAAVPSDAARHGPKVEAFEPRASDDARLRAAWQRWVDARTPHHATRVERTCGECQSQPPVVRTEVRRGRLVSVRNVTDDRALPWRRAQPIDQLYRLLRKAHREAADVHVRYSERGVPLSIAIDWSELIADEETYLDVRVRFGL
jgi:hypothetical protein